MSKLVPLSTPQVTLKQGLPELVEWSENQIAIDHTGQSLETLRAKGFLK